MWILYNDRKNLEPNIFLFKEFFIFLINNLLEKKNKIMIIFKIVKFHLIKKNRNFINNNLIKILEIKLY